MNQFLHWVKIIAPIALAIIWLVLTLAALLIRHFSKYHMWDKLKPDEKREIVAGESVLEYLGNVDVKKPRGEKK
jgi:hypothetical protein